MLALQPQCGLLGTAGVEDSFSAMQLAGSGGGGGGSAAVQQMLGGRRRVSTVGTRHRRTESHELALQLLYLGAQSTPYAVAASGPPQTAQEHAAAMHKRTRLENPPPPVQQSPSRAAEDVSKTPPRPHFDSVDCVSALAAGTNSPPTSSPTEPASNETPKAAAESETALWPCGMAMPLPPSVAWRMLSDSSQELPHRPNQFSAAAAEFIFKESGLDDKSQLRMKLSKEAVRSAVKSVPDRWHNSGGARGARDMKISDTEFVRRRYGSILQNGKIMWRYHEYCRVYKTGQVDVDAEGKPCDQSFEDRQTMLYHVMPRRTGRGRPAKSEVLAQSRLWARLTADGASA